MVVFFPGSSRELSEGGILWKPAGLYLCVFHGNLISLESQQDVEVSGISTLIVEVKNEKCPKGQTTKLSP